MPVGRQLDGEGMTDLSSIVGGGVISVQTGAVSAKKSGTGELAFEKSFLDVNLTSEVNTQRPIYVRFDGVFSSSSFGQSTATSFTATARLSNSTTVRIGSYATADYYFVGRWTLIEYA